ncbi:DisA bacterial checkpoint controller nucleotide-binding protein [uncultured archaeon]|nr:DisA bacterial checkpoint controller nucleotide-binding protein [uncultured archaeon]
MQTDKIIGACFDLAHKQDEGCLFVIESEKADSKYYKDYNTDIYKKNGRRLSVFKAKDKQLIRKLASIDGAVIISQRGEMLHYGATLINADKVVGHGKRHAFSMGTSRKVKGTICILASEEDRHIRAFRNGSCTVDIDEDTKLGISTRQKIAELIGAPITKTLVASGIATSILTLNPLPAILTIGGSFVIVSEGFNKLKSLVG